MTKEKLEKEAVEYAEKINLQNVNISGVVRNHISQAYLASAEPREKRIEELTKWLSEASDEKLKLQMLRVDLVSKIGKQEKRIAELEAQIEKMKCCGNCKHYQFQNDAGYYTCTKDGKRNGKNYRSCEFDLEKWEGR